MRCLENKIIKTILLILLIIIFLPILNYVIRAVIGIGRIMGTSIRILGTI